MRCAPTAADITDETPVTTSPVAARPSAPVAPVPEHSLPPCLRLRDLTRDGHARSVASAHALEADSRTDEGRGRRCAAIVRAPGAVPARRESRPVARAGVAGPGLQCAD